MPAAEGDRPVAATQQPGRRIYHALDGLRGVAAILVVLYHAEFMTGLKLVPNGYLAVDLFFVISGFVIAHAYDARLKAGLGIGRFALMRMIRFWPLYLAGLALGIVAQIGHQMAGAPQALDLWTLWASILLNAAFLPSLLPAYGNVLFPLNPVAWSLFFELVVNILYACFLPLLTRRVVAGLVLVTGIAFAASALSHGTTNIGWASTQIWPGLLRTVFSFSAGVLIARCGWEVRRVPAWLLALVVVFCLCVPVPGAARPVLALGFVLSLSPLIVAAGAGAQLSARHVRLAAMLGAMSFALYAVHKPLLSLAAMAGRALDVPGTLVGFAYLPLVGMFCVMLDRHYDAPLRRGLMEMPGRVRRALKPA